VTRRIHPGSAGCRVAHRDVIVDGRRFFYRFASSTVRGFIDRCVGSGGLRLRRLAGASWCSFLWHRLPSHVRPSGPGRSKPRILSAIAWFRSLPSRVFAIGPLFSEIFWVSRTPTTAAGGLRRSSQCVLGRNLAEYAPPQAHPTYISHSEPCLQVRRWTPDVAPPPAVAKSYAGIWVTTFD
jgi:hypothetical protein